MPRENGALGVFADPGQAAAAVRELRGMGRSDIRIATPAPYPGLIEALGRPRSRIDGIVMSGAALGVAAGFALCIGTSLSWPLLTGGKPIASIPPFVIIAFEIAVLVGAAVNLAVLTIVTFRGRRRRFVPFDARFSADRVGVFVPGGASAEVEAALRRAGAEEVRRVA
jgi:hypothetical protein